MTQLQLHDQDPERTLRLRIWLPELQRSIQDHRHLCFSLHDDVHAGEREQDRKRAEIATRHRGQTAAGDGEARLYRKSGQCLSRYRQGEPSRPEDQAAATNRHDCRNWKEVVRTGAPTGRLISIAHRISTVISRLYRQAIPFDGPRVRTYNRAPAAAGLILPASIATDGKRRCECRYCAIFLLLARCSSDCCCW